MIRSGNLFANLPERLPEEEAAILADRPGAVVERIVSTGHASPPGFWYDQDWAEWVIVLEGAAGLRIEGEAAPRRLGPGDYLEFLPTPAIASNGRRLIHQRSGSRFTGSHKRKQRLIPGTNLARRVARMESTRRRFAKAYSGLSDAEMREMDAIVRRTTAETFGPVRSVRPTQVFELGFEGVAQSRRHRSGAAMRFPACSAGGATSRPPRPTRSTPCARFRQRAVNEDFNPAS